MPARLDRVTIHLLRGPAELSWESREKLLEELGAFESASSIIRKFEGKGASAPVELSQPEGELLAEIITAWSQRVGVKGLPKGVWKLRRLLLDDQ